MESTADSLLFRLGAGTGSLATLMPDWEALEHSSLPQDLSGRQALRIGTDKSSSIGLLHCFHPESLPMLLEGLRGKVDPSAYAFTTDSGAKAQRIEAIARSILGSSCQIHTLVCENLGRDVRPFWIALKEFANGYDYFLKLHIKKVEHGDLFFSPEAGVTAADRWMQEIMRCLIPTSMDNYQSLLAYMQAEGLAALYPRPWWAVAKYGWGELANLEWVATFLRMQGLNGLNILLPLIYPPGNMFFGKVSSFLPLADFFLSTFEYPPEPAPIDGSILHAIERSYSYLLAAQGMNVGVLFPPLPESTHPCLRGWSFPLASYASRVASQVGQAPGAANQSIVGIYQRLSEAAMANHQQSVALREERDALLWKLRFQSRSPRRRLLSWFKRLASP